MAHVTINIPLPEIEKLFGADTTAAIEFRNAVVQNFASRHLKGLFTDEVRKATIKAIKAETDDLEQSIKTIVREEVGLAKTSWNPENVTLNSFFREAIKKDAREHVRSSVLESLKAFSENVDETKRITERRLALFVQDQLPKLIEDAVTKAVTDETVRQVKAKMAKLLTEEALG